MSRRGGVAIAVLAVWVGALAWHARRLYLRPPSELLAEAARTIPPGAAYYAVFRGPARMGWAQNEVDTLPDAGGFMVRDRLVLREPILPDEEPLRVEVEAQLGPTFSVRSFSLEAVGIPGLRRVEGVVHGDTLLELRAGEAADPAFSELRLDGPLFLAGAWPLRLAADGRLERGDRIRLPVFDPMTASSSLVDFTVLAAEEKSFPDSVTAVAGAWVTAREDTVQAWWIEQEVGGLRLRSWVDEDGRLLSSEIPGGLRLERTAFEFALFGDSVPESPVAPAAEQAGDSGNSNREPGEENEGR